jgi:hypothetical protein
MDLMRGAGSIVERAVIIQVSADPVGLNPLGQICNGKIRLRGLCMEVIVRKAPRRSVATLLFTTGKGVLGRVKEFRYSVPVTSSLTGNHAAKGSSC